MGTTPQNIFSEGDAYERFMGRWSRRLAPLFVTFASVADEDAVLDVGCGTGALASAIAERVPSARITGVDRSSDYVREARARASGRQDEFVVGDAQVLDFADASFDKCVSMLVMNFVPDPAKALREMIRVTRSGGLVAAAVWDYGDGMQMLRAFWDEAVDLDPTAGERDERNMPLCRPGELRSLWLENGLERVEEHPIEVALPFASFDDYWRPFLGGQGPAGAYTSSLSDRGRAALEAQLRRRLIGTGLDAPFTLPARVWAARGSVPAR